MKRFKFSLQTLHTLRERERDQAETRLAEADAEIRHAETHLQDATATHTRAAENYIAALHNGDNVDAHLCQMQADYLHALAHREQHARLRLHSLEATREHQRQLTVAAARAAETTANLREHHHARHRAELARGEQLALDEMATLAAARKSREETPSNETLKMTGKNSSR